MTTENEQTTKVPTSVDRVSYGRKFRDFINICVESAEENKKRFYKEDDLIRKDRAMNPEQHDRPPQDHNGPKFISQRDLAICATAMTRMHMVGNIAEAGGYPWVNYKYKNRTRDLNRTMTELGYFKTEEVYMSTGIMRRSDRLQFWVKPDEVEEFVNWSMKLEARQLDKANWNRRERYMFGIRAYAPLPFNLSMTCGFDKFNVDLRNAALLHLEPFKRQEEMLHQEEQTIMEAKLEEAGYRKPKAPLRRLSLDGKVYTAQNNSHFQPKDKNVAPQSSSGDLNE